MEIDTVIEIAVIAVMTMTPVIYYSRYYWPSCWLLKRPDPWKQWLKKHEATAISGWKEIYKHLEKIHEKCETDGDNEEKSHFTEIRYKGLTIEILGYMKEDQTLVILKKWEYRHMHIIRCAFGAIFDEENEENTVIIEGVIELKHQISNITYQYGLVERGPWKPLPSSRPVKDRFMVFKGSSDFKDVELFNGERNLYLKVKEEEIEGHRSKYKVKVAKRPLETDTSSHFDLSDGRHIKLANQNEVYLKYCGTEENHRIDVNNGQVDVNSPALAFVIKLYYKN